MLTAERVRELAHSIKRDVPALASFYQEVDELTQFWLDSDPKREAQENWEQGIKAAALMVEQFPDNASYKIRYEIAAELRRRIPPSNPFTKPSI